MSRLAYCVLSESERPADLLLQGVEGAAVSLTVADGLAAASSLVGEDAVVATLPRVTAYAEVVEKIHAVATVLPFRYGCFVKDEAELASLLHERGDQFEQTLGEVQDCVEMGLRVLLDDTAAAVPCGPVQAPSAASGKAYLTGLKNHYAARDSQGAAATEAAEALCRAFDGLYAKVLTEPPPRGGGPLLSLHFLVPRPRAARFREAFERLQEIRPTKMLLTGPWPPYNFAGGAAM